MEKQAALEIARDKANRDRRPQSLWMIDWDQYAATSYDEGDEGRPGFVEKVTLETNRNHQP